MSNKPEWLSWAQELQSIAHAGLEYSPNPFDRDRYSRILELAAEIVATHTALEFTVVHDLFVGEKGYQTPKVDVRAFVTRGDKILLVRELDGRWALPGGWAEPNLSVAENIRKEAAEEAGAIVAPRDIIAVLDRNKHLEDLYPYSVYKIFVWCDYESGTHVENIETSDARFFSWDDLPELSTGRTTPNQIELCRSYVEKFRVTGPEPGSRGARDGSDTPGGISAYPRVTFD